MSLFKKAGGLINEIRCDEPTYLVWKWHPAGAEPGSNRENAIRWGSSLRVKDGEVAVFVYKQKDGTLQEFIEGPFDQTIKTANFPILAGIVGLAYGNGTPFQAEVYFINLAHVIQVKFAVPFFDVYDPRFLDFSIPVAVRGSVNFRIANYREFIKLHRLINFSLADFQNQTKDAVIRYVKQAVANAPMQYNIPAVQMEKRIAEITECIERALTDRLNKDFGVDVSGADISAIEIDKTSEGYRRLLAVTREAEAAKIQAQTEDYTERLRMQREEERYAQHKQAQMANLAAFQVEKQAEVGVAGAVALGRMGAGVNLGGGVGFSPAAMMAGVAVGGAVGQGIAGAVGGILGAAGQTQPQSPSSQMGVVPPLPTVVYHIVLNGVAQGPYDLAALQQMAYAGQLKADSLIWKAGMPTWGRADSVTEIAALFNGATPPPPPVV